MSASLIRTGGVASVPSGATPSAPAILYDSDGVYVTDKDYGACNAYKITNTDSANWLWINIPKAHVDGEGTPLMPGETVTFVRGFNLNGITAIRAWGTTPGVGGSAVAVVVAGGLQKKI